MKGIKGKLVYSLERSLSWDILREDDGDLGEVLAWLGDLHPAVKADVSGHFMWYMVARLPEKERAI
jgi:hypothetical protein